MSSQDGPDLGEKALSKAAEIGIASQLDAVENVDVDIRTDPLKLVQGKVDSVSVSGEGMVMKQDLRMEQFEVNADKVAIDPLSAATGKIKLTAPTNADARIVLTEDDINRALCSDYLRNKIKQTELDIEGKPVTVLIQHIEVHFPEADRLFLKLTMQHDSELRRLKAVAVPHASPNGKKILLELESAEGDGLSLEFMEGLLEKMMELLDLSNFELRGMTLQLQDLKIEPGQLILQSATQITEFPEA